MRRSPTVFVFMLLAIPPIFLLRLHHVSYTIVSVLCSIAGFMLGGTGNTIASVMTAEVGKMEAAQGNSASLSTLSLVPVIKFA